MTRWPLHAMVIGVVTGLFMSATGDAAVGTLIQALGLLPYAALCATHPERAFPHEDIGDATRTAWSRLGAFVASAAVANVVFAGLALFRR